MMSKWTASRPRRYALVFIVLAGRECLINQWHFKYFRSGSRGPEHQGEGDVVHRIVEFHGVAKNLVRLRHRDLERERVGNSFEKRNIATEQSSIEIVLGKLQIGRFESD